MNAEAAEGLAALRHRRRRPPPARRARPGHPADGRHRPGRLDRGPRRDHGRADLVARAARGRAAARRSSTLLKESGVASSTSRTSSTRSSRLRHDHRAARRQAGLDRARPPSTNRRQLISRMLGRDAAELDEGRLTRLAGRPPVADAAPVLRRHAPEPPAGPRRRLAASSAPARSSASPACSARAAARRRRPIFGALPLDSGEISVDGQPAAPARPRPRGSATRSRSCPRTARPRGSSPSCRSATTSGSPRCRS